MGFLECASGVSIWRGYDYFTQRKVKDLKPIGGTQYSAKVVGTMQEPYIVKIDIAHPRKSQCNCPHADGKRIICKHMIAVYFTVFPKEAQRLYDEAMAYQEEEAKREEELYDKVVAYVGKMKKADLSQTLLKLLFNGPEWQYDRFVREHDLDDYE